MTHSAEQLANLMSLDETLFKTQVAQTEFRMRIAESWKIKPGMKLLEIGYGQGDMTLVLANAVGDAGHITAVDIAPPSYGAPMTLKQATSKIKASPLGARIDFAFNFNALDPAKTFKADQFDAIVLANSSWYFESLDELTRLLLKIRTWSPTLFYSEWDLQATSETQLPHLQSVLAQGLIAAHGFAGDSNVRTPFSKATLMKLLGSAGYRVHAQQAINTTGLQDADWEIAATLHPSSNLQQHKAQLPASVLALLESQLETIEFSKLLSGNSPLPVYAVVATRNC